MSKILEALLFFSCISLLAANRVYVHPFNLFAFDNATCQNIQSTQNEKMFAPPLIDLHNISEAVGSTHKVSDGTKQTINQKTKALAVLQNELGLRLYNALRKEKPGNTLFSPVNSFGTLVTFYLGASGKTATNFQNFLGLVKETDTENCTSPFDGHKVLTTLQHINSLTDGSTDELRTLVWTLVSSNVELSEDFARGTRDFSDHSYIGAVDFSKPTAAEALVNAFIERTSSGNTKSLFHDISSSSDLLFASSLHFKGKWKAAFQPEKTTEQEFQTPDKTSVSVPLMSRQGVYGFLNDKGNKCTIVKLPLSKKAFVLLVLPYEGTDLDHVESILSGGLISLWHRHMSNRFLDLSLPKFSMTAVNDLKAILTDLKLPYLLGENAAFGRLGRKPNFTVDKVLNKVVFEVSEEGSEEQNESQDHPAVTELKINRPFFFAIIEGNSDAILLMGRITNPLH
ncbi:ANGT protein, partial [Amia calva]|nr:ANGT protein [Amia calva]